MTPWRYLASAIRRLRGDRWDLREEARKRIERMVELRGDPQPQLSKAIAEDDADQVAALLGSGLDPNAADRRGETPLMYAAYRGRTGAVRTLLGAGARPEDQNLDGNTALHLAVDEVVDAATQDGITIGDERLGTIRALLEAGARIDVRNLRGQTAVDWAHGFERILELLLRSR